jgi:dTDP-4-amino-4,6-dideoxygalactose transaminase
VTVVAAGINGKMHEVSAAFGLLQLKGIDAAIEKRGRSPPITARCPRRRARHRLHAELGHEANFGYFPILVGDDYPLGRDGLYQKLRDAASMRAATSTR